MTFLDKAIKDGFAYITGEDTKRKITYVISDNHTEYYNDPRRTGARRVLGRAYL